MGAEFYHPLGLCDKVSAVFKDKSKFAADLSRKTGLQIYKVRMYNPPLVHCRVSTIRNLPSICAAATLLGGQSAIDGPYQSVIEKANLVSGALRSGFEYIKANGADLRLEIVVEGVEHLNNEKIFNS
jgi:hypothetical protein